MGVTIRDVAREAAVSVSTVSRVFNRRELVNDETRAHIEHVAQRLGYVPHATARSLSIRKTNVLGAILPELFDEFFPEVIRGIDETAQRMNYQLLLSSSHNRVSDARKVLPLMRGRVDGLLIMAPYEDAGALLDGDGLTGGLPVVYLNCSGADGRCDSFRVDNFGGARKAMEHLLLLGHRRIAVIKGRVGNLDAQERLAGCHAALEAAGVVRDSALEVPGAFTRESGWEAGRRILEMDVLPTALFASNDYMAIGAMSALQQAGIRIPEDIAVIGFDDVPSSQYAHPPLSSVHVPVWELGKQATEQLLARVEGRNGKDPRTALLPTEVVARASTAASPAH